MLRSILLFLKAKQKHSQSRKQWIELFPQSDKELKKRKGIMSWIETILCMQSILIVYFSAVLHQKTSIMMLLLSKDFLVLSFAFFFLFTFLIYYGLLMESNPIFSQYIRLGCLVSIFIALQATMHVAPHFSSISANLFSVFLLLLLAVTYLFLFILLTNHAKDIFHETPPLTNSAELTTYGTATESSKDWQNSIPGK